MGEERLVILRLKIPNSQSNKWLPFCQAYRVSLILKINIKYVILRFIITLFLQKWLYSNSTKQIRVKGGISFKNEHILHFNLSF